ncbi:hypothetical protein CHS0354_027902 [Potamilus streckersoni]|uniref:Uncharacterized protein n=1 Tax=Potamilus streckersoni TaxID=2493646 RepID=A0AAE0T4G3_9BIVA|nr:hypothetical protein CHS0354_027902 [Potamilus streckersoni]
MIMIKNTSFGICKFIQSVTPSGRCNCVAHTGRHVPLHATRLPNMHSLCLHHCRGPVSLSMDAEEASRQQMKEMMEMHEKRKSYEKKKKEMERKQMIFDKLSKMHWEERKRMKRDYEEDKFWSHKLEETIRGGDEGSR